MAFLILAFDKIEIYKQYHLQQKKKRKKKIMVLLKYM